MIDYIHSSILFLKVQERRKRFSYKKIFFKTLYKNEGIVLVNIDETKGLAKTAYGCYNKVKESHVHE